MKLSRAAASGILAEVPQHPEEPRALAASLERAMAGREGLVRTAQAAPHDPALREALRRSTAHVEALLARLRAVAPPELRTRDA